MTTRLTGRRPSPRNTLARAILLRFAFALALSSLPIKALASPYGGGGFGGGEYGVGETGSPVQVTATPTTTGAPGHGQTEAVSTPLASSTAKPSQSGTDASPHSTPGTAPQDSPEPGSDAGVEPEKGSTDSGEEEPALEVTVSPSPIAQEGKTLRFANLAMPALLIVAGLLILARLMRRKRTR